eukprot:jgi/Mesvir1/11788/Mv00152-RA.1
MATDMEFHRKNHIAYLLRNLRALPAPYAQNESNCVTLAYFLISSLALLDSLDEVKRDDIIDWVYALQVLPRVPTGGMDPVPGTGGRKSTRGCQQAITDERGAPSPTGVRNDADAAAGSIRSPLPVANESASERAWGTGEGQGGRCGCHDNHGLGRVVSGDATSQEAGTEGDEGGRGDDELSGVMVDIACVGSVGFAEGAGEGGRPGTKLSTNFLSNLPSGCAVDGAAIRGNVRTGAAARGLDKYAGEANQCEENVEGGGMEGIKETGRDREDGDNSIHRDKNSYAETVQEWVGGERPPAEVSAEETPASHSHITGAQPTGDTIPATDGHAGVLGADGRRLTSGLHDMDGINMSGGAAHERDRPVGEWRAWADMADARSLGGFRGSFAMAGALFSPGGAPSTNEGDLPHLANTYAALALLTLMGDDLARVHRPGIARLLGALQHPDGSFSGVSCGGERDLRFVFSAAAVCTLLGSWEGMDQDRAYAFIRRTQSHDGAFGLSPGLESHGGSTYCAVASLALLGRLDEAVAGGPHGIYTPLLATQHTPLVTGGLAASALARWCVMRQTAVGGLQGRINKPADSCYAFWLGASLSLLGAEGLIARDDLRGFLLSCQNEKYGGFSKSPYQAPDLLHTFYSLCGLSLLGNDGLCALDCKLGIPLLGALRLSLFVQNAWLAEVAVDMPGSIVYFIPVEKTNF